MSTWNLADLFECVADVVPGRTAIVCANARLTYGALDQRATRLANHWRAQGIGAGQHIGLHLRNGAEYLEGMLAAWKLRAVPININFNYVEAELEYLYDDADLVAVVVHREFIERVAAVRGALPKLHEVLCVEDGTSGTVPPSARAYEDSIAAASPVRDVGPRSGDDRYIVYTGGTTGRPKGVIWRHEDIFFAALGGGDPEGRFGPIERPEELVERIAPQPMVALPAPPFMHAAAQWLAMNTLYAGGTLVIPPRGVFEPQAIWRAIATERVNLLVIVGDAMAVPLIDTYTADPSRHDATSLAVIASGGALFSPSTKHRLLEILPGRVIIDGLGASETGAMGSKVNAQGLGSEQPRFTVNAAMTVLDENDHPVAPGSGVIGRLAKRGHVPLGYHKAPEKSATTFVTIEGARWAIPGDLAMVEPDGSILLLGRGSTCINTGGEKVFPEEVESALKAHPDIVDVLVVGVPDPRWGQKVVALCTTRSGTLPALAAMRDFCRGTLAGYKLPREFLHVAEIKRTPAAKADYVWARDYAVAALHERGGKD